jgi:muconolactone D-isomerase
MGMEFLVQIVVNIPADMDTREREQLLEAEKIRGRQLMEAGAIRAIWRIAGKSANVGIWQAADGNALHSALISLPLFPWLEVSVTPLATHPLNAAE